MLLSLEEWMNVRALRAMRQAGATWADIAREAGCDWRTVKKYLADDAAATPPAVGARPAVPKLIDPYTDVIDAWLTSTPRLQASVIHKRLVAEHGFSGSYQRTKLYVGAARERICPTPPELHRRFEVLPGSQAQVDWGDEGVIDTPEGPVRVFSFHMTLSYSRDPFCCFVASQDLTSFWDCHRRAFDHFGGVPATVVYDRTKTVVKRHVRRHAEVPLHPEAVAFAAHYGFSIVVAPARRPQFKGRVERQVKIVRDQVLTGREFTSMTGMDQAFTAWVPLRRADTHRTHGEVIGTRAEVDHAALGPIPAHAYVVCERHLRKVAKDCLVSFEASLYSVPWRQVRRRMSVECRVTPTTVAIWTTGPEPQVLATHPRAVARRSWVVDSAHWEGLPAAPAELLGCAGEALVQPIHHDQVLMGSASAKAATPVGRRDLSTYDEVARRVA